MTEPLGIPIDVKLVLTFVGVLIPLCVWFSRYQTKVHKKIHKRLDVIEEEIQNLRFEDSVRKVRQKK